MCSRPRKPQRNPKPRAVDVSGSKKSELSFNRSFSSASRNAPYSWPSTGYSPAKTIGLSSLKPGKASAVWRAVSVTVSPICASRTFLMFAVRNPTSPGPSSSTGVDFGRNTPSDSIG